MPARIRAAFEAELGAARTAETSQQLWTALARAHILSQPCARPDTRAHALMLRVAWREHDRHEAARPGPSPAGRRTRICHGRYPEGNTGRATVPLTQPMPVPPDLAQLLTHPGHIPAG